METHIQQDPKLTELIKSLKGLNAEIKDEAWQAAKDESLKMETDIKNAMPVDTGRAKAGWGHWTPEDLQGLSGPPSKHASKFTVVGIRNREQVASSSDAIWIEDQPTMTVTQGTTVPYTQYLEQGHSDAAPAGFIADAEELAQGRLQEVADRLIKRAEAFLTGVGVTIPSAIAKYKPSGGKLSVEKYVQEYRKSLGRVYPSKKKPIKRKK